MAGMISCGKISSSSQRRAFGMMRRSRELAHGLLQDELLVGELEVHGLASRRAPRAAGRLSRA